MARHIELKSQKTYANKANCIKAVETLAGHTDVRYLVVRDDEGRYYPIFLGEQALQLGLHFHFPIAG